MTDSNNYRIEIGEHGILGVGAHLSVRFVDSEGNRIAEINGLATNPNGAISPIGAAVLGHDIRGYIWTDDDYTFFASERTRSIDTLAERSLEDLQNDLSIVAAVVEEINASNISYQVLNTNSNSVAMTALRAIGFTVEDVRAITGRLTPGINIELLTDEQLEEIRAAILENRELTIDSSLRPVSRPNDECFFAETLIKMWPLDTAEEPQADGNYDEQFVLSKTWEKPISEIKVGDLVVAYDGQGRLAPKPVTRLFKNTATHILDFWGTGVTPGHAYYCADGKFKGQHIPLMDILRTDGAIMKVDGKVVRAATNCEVGSMGDLMIHAAATVQDPDGSWSELKPGKVRFGTRIILPDGRDMSLMEIAHENGWKISDDGYIVGLMNGGDGEPQERVFHFPFTFAEELPKPEDYILERSDVTLDAIYAAGEWEQIGTQLSAPEAMVGVNANNTITLLQPSRPEPNVPPAFSDHPDAPLLSQCRQMNCKERKVSKSETVH